MIETSGQLLHYGTIALTVGINSIGVGLGEGLSSKAALKAINIQPSAHNEITRLAILGSALIETSAILGVFIAFLLLFAPSESATLFSHTAEIGIAIAICLSGFIISLASSLPAKEACLAVARQPFFADKIFRFMLITQSIIQTPFIFSFIIAMFIKNNAAHVDSMAQSLQLIAAGLAMGLGSIGPAIGLAQFAQQATRGLGVNRRAYNQLLSFTLVSQAIIETPAIFAMVISLMLIFFPNNPTLLDSIAYLSAALCIGLGTLGSGAASGKTASSAVYQIALHPELQGTIGKVSMFAQGLIDTCAIYTFIIAVLLILFR